MQVIGIISQKGGVSKTTIATALAVEASRDGKKTVLLDLDPQASASFWKDTRVNDDLAISAIPASRLAHVIAAAREAGCDLAIVDSPPYAKDVALEAAQQADFVLVPTRPAILDIMATARTLELLRLYSRPFAVVLTFCPPTGREIEDTAKTIEELGAELCPVRIGARIAYSRAQQLGLAAQEIDPFGKAALEIKELYTYVCVNLNTYERRSHDQLDASHSRQSRQAARKEAIG
jgi:chromosome partitioning protein